MCFKKKEFHRQSDVFWRDGTNVLWKKVRMVKREKESFERRNISQRKGWEGDYKLVYTSSSPIIRCSTWRIFEIIKNIRRKHAFHYYDPEIRNWLSTFDLKKKKKLFFISSKIRMSNTNFKLFDW